jgi:glycosyltransferase involved in cell wall biosynthesis
MHAAFVLPRFYPYRGGYENSMLSIAKCLVSRGHRVSVFTTTADDLESLWLPGYKTFPAGKFEIEGVTVHRLPPSYHKIARRLSRFAGLVPYWRWKSQYWRPAFAVDGLREALRKSAADTFHVGPLPYNNLIYAGIEAAEALKVPVVATPCVHFAEGESSDVARQYLQPHQMELLRHCARVLCMTTAERELLTRKGVQSGRLTVIGHGFDLAQATGGDGEQIRRQYGIDGPLVLHLGMKAYDKGSITLLEAMKLLWSRGSNAWLLMAGPSLRAFDEHVAQQPRLPKLINLPAFADEDKRHLLAAADIVVQPSRVESLGIVLLESWANAKPVIAADIPVSRALVSQAQAGCVVPFGDSGRLADAISEALAARGSRRDAREQAREFAMSYDGRRLWQRNAEEFERVVTRGADS